MRGHHPILTLKLYVLFNILTAFRCISLNVVEQGSFYRDKGNEGSPPYTNFETVCFVQYFDFI